MSKSKQIEFFKKQLESAKELKSVSMQNYQIATRIESEAKSALKMLGANSERTRKGNILPEQIKNSLRASLTK